MMVIISYYHERCDYRNYQNSNAERDTKFVFLSRVIDYKEEVKCWYVWYSQIFKAVKKPAIRKLEGSNFKSVKSRVNSSCNKYQDKITDSRYLSTTLQCNDQTRRDQC